MSLKMGIILTPNTLTVRTIKQDNNNNLKKWYREVGEKVGRDRSDSTSFTYLVFIIFRPGHAFAISWRFHSVIVLEAWRAQKKMFQ